MNPRLPNDAALITFREWVKAANKLDNPELPRAMVLGMIEAHSDLTTTPPKGWEEEYDTGREIARALLGID